MTAIKFQISYRNKYVDEFNFLSLNLYSNHQSSAYLNHILWYLVFDISTYFFEGSFELLISFCPWVFHCILEPFSRSKSFRTRTATLISSPEEPILVKLSNDPAVSRKKHKILFLKFILEVSQFLCCWRLRAASSF